MASEAGDRWFPARIVVGLLGLKLLLVPAYFSTDFEVHRNWLAVTSSQPLSRWYVEDTSEWTLDYPPFFAWFEWALSRIASAFSDREMLRVDNLGYASPSTILFQRLSVMATESLLVGAVLLGVRRCSCGSWRATAVLMALVLGSGGLIIVDHLHFQYNGMLMGIFLSSAILMSQGRELLAAVLFAVALNLKHIFMYCAPVYFVHLLATFCFTPGPHQAVGRGPFRFNLRRFLQLGSCVLAVFGASLGPIAATGQLTQLAGRLFPFGRGLCHAYWAANAWALYSGLDKVLSAALPRLGVAVLKPAASMTGGLVGMAKFTVLPQIEPIHTAVLVLLAQAPALWRLWTKPHDTSFLHAVAFANMSAFMFGFHVHEKAALMITLPLAFLALESRGLAGLYLFVSTTAHYAITPLIFTQQEYGIKVLVVAMHALLATHLLRNWHDARGLVEEPTSRGLANTTTGEPNDAMNAGMATQQSNSHKAQPLLRSWEWAYICGLGAIEAYSAAIHPILCGSSRLQFLPLMLISVYCALGMSYAWLRMAAPYLPSSISSRLLRAQ